jgi:hypothetical protein
MSEIQKVDSDSRKELLAEQFSAIEAEAAAPAPEAAPQPEPEAAAEPAGERARDASGRFAKAAPAGPQATASEAPEPAEEPVWRRPPQSWKKEMHDFWAKADPRLQEYAYQREEQMRAGIEPIRAKAEFADAMNEAIAPYMDRLTWTRSAGWASSRRRPCGRSWKRTISCEIRPRRTGSTISIPLPGPTA